MAKRISIINFKGGVGKTTLAFHLGTGLARYHEKKVLLVDMDHQSSLSIVCLGAIKWQEAVENNRTIGEIFRPFIESDLGRPDQGIIVKSPMEEKFAYSWNRHYNSMDIVPASLHLDDIEIELTASHHGNAIRSEWDKRTLLCRWIEETGIDDLYDYIIFDCPPATKIVSQNAIAASHGYVIPVVPEAVMERGAPHLREMMRASIDKRLKLLATMGESGSRVMHVADTELVGLVVTRIQSSGRGASGYTDDHTQHLSSLEKFWQGKLMKPYIGHGTGVPEALADGVPVYDRSRTQNIRGRGFHKKFEELTRELKKRIDSL